MCKIALSESGWAAAARHLMLLYDATARYDDRKGQLGDVLFKGQHAAFSIFGSKGDPGGRG